MALYNFTGNLTKLAPPPPLLTLLCVHAMHRPRPLPAAGRGLLPGRVWTHNRLPRPQLQGQAEGSIDRHLGGPSSVRACQPAHHRDMAACAQVVPRIFNFNNPTVALNLRFGLVGELLAYVW